MINACLVKVQKATPNYNLDKLFDVDFSDVTPACDDDRRNAHKIKEYQQLMFMCYHPGSIKEVHS